MSERKWYRVIDPLNPLFGGDVTGMVEEFPGIGDVLCVTGMRRIDIVIGNRPFQLIAAEGDYLGLIVDMTHLEDSPLQDDVVEIAKGPPFGRCVSESEMTRKDGTTLRVVDFENAAQCSICDVAGNVLSRKTLLHPDVGTRVSFENIVEMFGRNEPVEDVVNYLENQGV